MSPRMRTRRTAHPGCRETPARKDAAMLSVVAYEQARAELTSDLDEIIGAEERAHIERTIRALVGNTYC